MAKQLYGFIILKKIILSFWLLFCMTVFFRSAATMSHTQQYFFGGWKLLAAQITRIDYPAFLIAAIGSIPGILIFSLATSLFGIFILSFWSDRDVKTADSLSEMLAYLGTAFLIGNIVSSSIFLLLASLGQIKPIIDGYVILIMMILGIWPAIKLSGTVRATNFLTRSSQPWGRFDRTLGWLCASIILISLFYSSARLSYDATAVYFSDEKLTAMAGKIQFFPNDSFIVSSFHTGIGYSVLIQLFGDQTARLLSWISGIVFILLALGCAGRLHLSRRASLIYIGLILTSTAFTDLLGDGKVDLLSSDFALAAAYWMLIDIQQDKAKIGYAVLVGIFAGYAAMARPFYVFILGVFILILYLQLFFPRRASVRPNAAGFPTRMLGMVLGAAPLLLFHLLMNRIILGDFLAPIANLQKTGQVSMWQWSFDPDLLWLFRLLFPFIASFRNSPQSLGNISPLILGFVPALFFRPVRAHLQSHPNTVRIAAVALLTLIIWIAAYFAVEEIRYVLFLWAIIYLPVALLIEACLHGSQGGMKYLVKIILVVTLLLIGFRSLVISLSTYSPLNRDGAPQCLGTPYCDYLRTINSVAMPGERVLSLSAFRYYLRPDLFACSTKAKEYLLLQNAALASSNEFWIEAYRQGYRYIAFERNYAVRHLFIDLLPDPANVPNWMSLEPLHDNGTDPMKAYKIQIAFSPASSTSRCIKDPSGVWGVEP